MCNLSGHASFQYSWYMAIPVNSPLNTSVSLLLLMFLSKWHCFRAHCSKLSESRSNSISPLPSTHLKVWGASFFSVVPESPKWVPSGSFGSGSPFSTWCFFVLSLGVLLRKSSRSLLLLCCVHRFPLLWVALKIFLCIWPDLIAFKFCITV